MKKLQYLNKLKVKLIKNGLKKAEIDGALQYYAELIDEAVDSGETEDAVVARLPSPQAAADEIKDEIKGVNDPSDEAAVQPSVVAIRPPVQSSQSAQPSTGAKSSSVKPSNGGKNRSVGAIVTLSIVFALFILPLMIIAAAVVFSAFAALFSVMASMIACGIALPVYAVIAALMSQSSMLLFAYLAAGFACLAVGILLIKVTKPLAALFVKIIKGMFKACISIFKRS